MGAGGDIVSAPGYTEAGVSNFLTPERTEQLGRGGAGRYVYEPDRPPLPPLGLNIARAEDGTWRTFQKRYPDSTLTSGHADNIEAFWACWHLRDVTDWAVTIDLRHDDPAWEMGLVESHRVRLAYAVDRVDTRFACWRAGPRPEIQARLADRRDVGVPGLRLARYHSPGGRIWPWGVELGAGWSLTRNCIPTIPAGRRVARSLGEVADWSAVPPWVLEGLPGFGGRVQSAVREALGEGSAA